MHRHRGRRAHAVCKSKRTFLVIVRTELEAQYVHFIRRRLNQPVQLETLAEDTDVNGMITRARKLERAGRGGGGNVPDEIWCFVNASELGAIPESMPSKVRLAVSSPGFPAWLLMHFKSLHPNDSLDTVIHEVGDHLPDLRGPLTEEAFAPLVGRYETARAAAIAATTSGSAALTVHQLIDSMCESIRDYRGPGWSTPAL